MSPINFDHPRYLDGYKPAKERVRHLTYEPVEPPAGIFVECLCGGIIHVGYIAASPIVYDCAACAEVWDEQHQTPAIQSSPLPPSASCPPLDGRAKSSVGAGAPTPAPTGGEAATWR